MRLLLRLALVVVVITAISASAATLNVDGGTLQVFQLPVEVPGPTPPPECAGMEFDAVIEGTEGPDVIVAADWDDGHFGGHGGNRRHLIFGYGGTDPILRPRRRLGRAGDARVYGGHNDDYIAGGPGDDLCVGGPGAATIVNCERFGPHPPWG